MTKINLYQAHDQWAKRPADERFWTIDDMYDTCRGYYDSAREADTRYADLEVAADGSDLALLGKERLCRFTHFSFGQLCSRMSAPVGYLRTLPAPVTSDVLNYHLKAKGSDGARLLLHENGSLVCRAFTSGEYSRIWNWEILDRLRNLNVDGWSVPPARAVAGADTPGARQATEEDLLASTINLSVGDWIAPAGLYASDQDMFAFLVNDSVRIDDGTDQGLGRGVFVSNSEVGAASAGKILQMTF